jgi:hypothetical protein
MQAMSGESELLGYEKWQNDIFFEYMKRVREERRKEREKWLEVWKQQAMTDLQRRSGGAV